MPQEQTTRISLPPKLAPLMRPARYKVLYGGRGSGKSVGAARALLAQGMQERHRILCAREFQASMRDSVHKLLADEIDALGLGWFYDVQATVIRGTNGTEFIFKGLRHNIAEIKSTQGITRCWVEEAQAVSKASWDTLVPTIRAEGSEIWVTFNPELDTDETYRRFVLTSPPSAVVVKVNHSDNPWFPAVLEAERIALQASDPDAYMTVWEGATRQVLDGAVYARELRDATATGRIMRVPVDPARPVDTYWDLGRADATSIWFVQTVGYEFRIVDFEEGRGYALNHYLRCLQDRAYLYGTHWLPHDADAKLLASERTIAQQVRAAYPGQNRVRVLAVAPVAGGIEAVRTVFPRCYFDEARCADGLNHLRRYRYDVDEKTGTVSKQPLHDEASHAADAFRVFGSAAREPREKAPPKTTTRRMPQGAGSWMG